MSSETNKENEIISQKEIEALIEAALQAREQAYAPYSKFKVGAAVLTAESAEIFTGVNVENSSYGASICAERTAVVKAVSSKCLHIKAIAICGFKDQTPVQARTYAYPCGICRQFINEFANADTLVLVVKDKEDYQLVQFKKLLTYSFNADNLV